MLTAATAMAHDSTLTSRIHPAILNRAKDGFLARVRDRDRDPAAAHMESMSIGGSIWLFLTGGDKAAAAVAAAAAGGQTAYPAATMRITSVLRPARTLTVTTTPAVPAPAERDFKITAGFHLRNSAAAEAAEAAEAEAEATGLAAEKTAWRRRDVGVRLKSVLKRSYQSRSLLFLLLFLSVSLSFALSLSHSLSLSLILSLYLILSLSLPFSLSFSLSFSPSLSPFLPLPPSPSPFPSFLPSLRSLLPSLAPSSRSLSPLRSILSVCFFSISLHLSLSLLPSFYPSLG